MARSYKKNAIHGITTADSNKVDKQLGNRKHRKHISDELQDLNGLDIDTALTLAEELTLEEYETHANDWSYDKDGVNANAMKKKVVSDEEYAALLLDNYDGNIYKDVISNSEYQRLLRK